MKMDQSQRKARSRTYRPSSKPFYQTPPDAPWDEPALLRTMVGGCFHQMERETAAHRYFRQKLTQDAGYLPWTDPAVALLFKSEEHVQAAWLKERR